MTWWGKTSREPDDSEPDEQAQQATSEFLDQDHPRASLHDGNKIIIRPGKVLDNIEGAMERVDLDINTDRKSVV